MKFTVNIQRRNRRNAPVGQDAYPYASDNFLIVADGLGGSGGFVHKETDPAFYDREKAVKAIRKVDTNHIIILGGAHCNSKFKDIFTGWTYDDKLMWECHHYGGKAEIGTIKKYIDWRDRTGLPMYMGEIGHNSMEWISTFRKLMNDNNIGWTYWTYKHMSKKDGYTLIDEPENWKLIKDFANSPRGSYEQIRNARPDQAIVRQAMKDYLEAIKFKNCRKGKEYIKSLGLESD